MSQNISNFFVFCWLFYGHFHYISSVLSWKMYVKGKKVIFWGGGWGVGKHIDHLQDNFKRVYQNGISNKISTSCFYNIFVTGDCFLCHCLMDMIPHPPHLTESTSINTTDMWRGVRIPHPLQLSESTWITIGI